MRIFKLILSLAPAALLAVACGGGSQDASTGPGGNALPGGVWTGQIVAPGEVQLVAAVTTDGGEFRVLDLATQGQFAGTITVNGNSATGSGLGWAGDGATWMDGSSLTTLNITGAVTERQRISGDWTAGSGETGTYTLAYNSIHARASSLAKLAANWFFTDGTYALAVSINGNGDITGSDTDGCVLNGSASIPDAAFNTYALTIDLSSCGAVSGRYQGLAYLADTQAEGDTLVAGLDDGLNSVVLALGRPVPVP